jgi:hypothetical protein
VIAALALLLAVPAEKHLALPSGAHHIEKIAPGALAVETSGPLKAELLPSGNEVLIEPQGAGQVFLFYKRDVRVLAVGAAPATDAKPPACAPIADEKCYASWREYAATAPELPHLVFEITGLQAQAKAAQDELNKAGLGKVQVAFTPYGVKLSGAKDEAETRHALMAVWKAALGPLRVETQ